MPLFEKKKQPPSSVLWATPTTQGTNPFYDPTYVPPAPKQAEVSHRGSDDFVDILGIGKQPSAPQTAPEVPEHAPASSFTGEQRPQLASKRQIEKVGGKSHFWNEVYPLVLAALDGYHGAVAKAGPVDADKAGRKKQGDHLRMQLLKLRGALNLYNGRHEGEDGARHERLRQLTDEAKAEEGYVQAVIDEPAYDEAPCGRSWYEAMALVRSGLRPRSGNHATFTDETLRGPMKPLGSGAVNQVFSASYKGEQNDRVWKEETHGKQVGVEMVMSLPQKDRNYAGRNVALSRLNELFQLDVVPKTDFAVHDGRVGTVMEKVRGAKHASKTERGEIDKSDPEIQNLLQEKANYERIINDKTGNFGGAAKEDARQNLASVEGDLQRKGLEERDGKLYGQRAASTGVDYDQPVVKKGLSSLQLLDALCASGDRHAGNYMFETNGNGQVTGVKGIDNDFAFSRNGKANDPEHMKGQQDSNNMGVPDAVDADVADRFLAKSADQVRACLTGLLDKAEVDSTVKRFERLQVILQKRKDEGKLVSDWSRSDALLEKGKRGYWHRDKDGTEKMPLAKGARRERPEVIFEGQY